MHGSHDAISSIKSLDVQNAPMSGGKIQHGVVASSPMLGTTQTYTAQGDGSDTDLTATTQAHVGASGAYLDDSTGDTPLTYIGTLATTAIGDQYAPWGDERCLLLPTERGYAFLFEHGYEDTPAPKQGERYALHRANPKGNYNSAVFDAGWRFLNDGPTANDGLGTTEVGYEGAHTVLKTKGGWILDEDDTAKKLRIYFPDGTLAFVCDGNNDTVLLPGATNTTPDAVMNASQVQTALNALATAIRTWAGASFQTGSSSPGVLTAPTVVGSVKSFSV